MIYCDRISNNSSLFVLKVHFVEIYTKSFIIIIPILLL